MIRGVPSEVRTKDVPSTNLEHYHSVNTFRVLIGFALRRELEELHLAQVSDPPLSQ